MLSGDWKQFSDPQAVEFVDKSLLFLAINFVDREEQRLAAAEQQSSNIEVGRGELAAPVHHQDDGVSLFKRDFGLAEDFCRDQLFFVGFDSAGVHDAQAVSAEVRFAVEAIAGYPRFIADNRAARTHDAIEQRRLADVGPSNDG